jgi:hypothetical protein
MQVTDIEMVLNKTENFRGCLLPCTIHTSHSQTTYSRQIIEHYTKQITVKKITNKKDSFCLLYIDWFCEIKECAFNRRFG